MLLLHDPANHSHWGVSARLFDQGIAEQNGIKCLHPQGPLDVHPGQGLALALEDAVVLAWHLRRQGLSQQALRR